jgi:DNA-binding transcriptional regulator YdaS (Cro superfamily)
MSKKSAAEKVVEAFSGMKLNDRGAKSKAASVLGVSRQLINYWLLSKIIPSQKHAMILKAAKKNNIELMPADLVNQ